MSSVAQQPQNRILVVARVRPALDSDPASEIAVKCSEDQSSIKVSSQKKQATNIECIERDYKFDVCLPGSCNQDEFYEACCIDELVDAAVRGYHVTIFAYGQTGSGKTYTMIGCSQNEQNKQQEISDESGVQPYSLRSSCGTVPTEQSSFLSIDMDRNQQFLNKTPQSTVHSENQEGLLPRCTKAIQFSVAQSEALSRLDNRNSETNNSQNQPLQHKKIQFDINVSCCEIYNEQASDLLGSRQTNLAIKRKQLPTRQPQYYVDQLSQYKYTSKNQNFIIKKLQNALEYRHSRRHRLNEQSSRSHCIITFDIQQTIHTQVPDGQTSEHIIKKGVLRLVDLAGSERLKQTGSYQSKDALQETGCINKSLFVLGQVISSLSSNNPRQPPYRESKLTQLLYSGLTGHARTLMVACCAPQARYLDETVSTLHYATMAKHIKIEPRIVLDPHNQAIQDLKTAIKELKMENQALLGALAAASGGDQVKENWLLPKHLQDQLLQLKIDQDDKEHSIVQRSAASSSALQDQKASNSQWNLIGKSIKRFSSGQLNRKKLKQPGNIQENSALETRNKKDRRYSISSMISVVTSKNKQAINRKDQNKKQKAQREEPIKEDHTEPANQVGHSSDVNLKQNYGLLSMATSAKKQTSSIKVQNDQKSNVKFRLRNTNRCRKQSSFNQISSEGDKLGTNSQHRKSSSLNQIKGATFYFNKHMKHQKNKLSNRERLYVADPPLQSESGSSPENAKRFGSKSPVNKANNVDDHFPELEAIQNQFQFLINDEQSPTARYLQQSPTYPNVNQEASQGSMNSIFAVIPAENRQNHQIIQNNVTQSPKKKRLARYQDAVDNNQQVQNWLKEGPSKTQFQGSLNTVIENETLNSEQHNSQNDQQQNYNQHRQDKNDLPARDLKDSLHGRNSLPNGQSQNVLNKYEQKQGNNGVISMDLSTRDMFQNQMKQNTEQLKLALWAQENQWYGTDQQMTKYALQIHNQIINSCAQIETDQYLAMLDQAMLEKFPAQYKRHTYNGKQKIAEDQNLSAISQYLIGMRQVDFEFYSKEVAERQSQMARSHSLYRSQSDFTNNRHFTNKIEKTYSKQQLKINQLQFQGIVKTQRQGGDVSRFAQGGKILSKTIVRSLSDSIPQETSQNVSQNSPSLNNYSYLIKQASQSPIRKQTLGTVSDIVESASDIESRLEYAKIQDDHRRLRMASGLINKNHQPVLQKSWAWANGQQKDTQQKFNRSTTPYSTQKEAQFQCKQQLLNYDNFVNKQKGQQRGSLAGFGSLQSSNYAQLKLTRELFERQNKDDYIMELASIKHSLQSERQQILKKMARVQGTVWA